jgi:hypothetical protein
LWNGPQLTVGIFVIVPACSDEGRFELILINFESFRQLAMIEDCDCFTTAFALSVQTRGIEDSDGATSLR